jgi:hypothetical protein
VTTTTQPAEYQMEDTIENLIKDPAIEDKYNLVWWRTG